MKIQLTNSIDSFETAESSVSHAEFLDRLFCFQLRAGKRKAHQSEGYDDLFRIWLGTIERQNVLREKPRAELAVDRS